MDQSTTDIKTEHFRNKKRKQSDDSISFGRRHERFCDKRSSVGTPSKNRNTKQKSNKKDPSRFRYGNYHQYYGYRNQGQHDTRMLCMKKEWFEGKDVLDVGCNAGHFTLAIARDFSPKSIVGIDIDHELVKMSKRNIRHYVTPNMVTDDSIPMSLVLSYGPVAQSLDPRGKYSPGSFPFNVQFIQGNYVLPSDDSLNDQWECFDTILCLSLTKWIHLNWGDTGIKRLFQRIHRQLRPGGYLILEAQSYESYARKKKITQETLKNYNEIQLFPEMFNEYLLKEVCFHTCELIDTPAHSSQGFSRPLYLFMKKLADAEESSCRKHVIYHYSSESGSDNSEAEISD